MTRARVVFVGGAGRSGSTLLGRLLATSPDAVMAGELVHLWGRGVGGDQLCGCGLRFHACPFWTAVGREAFGGWDTPAVTTATVLQARLDRQRLLPWMLLPGLAPARVRDDLRVYLRTVGRLYGAIAHVAGVTTVVDTSKHGSTAHLLRHAADLDLHALLLVRHPGGVAHSWSKSVPRREIVDDQVTMPTYTAVRSATDWTLRNAELHLLAGTGVPVERLRYEDLVRDPAGELATLCASLDLAPTTVGSGPVDLPVSHTVAGHPNRLDSGVVTVRDPDDWQAATPRGTHALVAGLTYPLRAIYGYGRRGVAP